MKSLASLIYFVCILNIKICLSQIKIPKVLPYAKCYKSGCQSCLQSAHFRLSCSSFCTQCTVREVLGLPQIGSLLQTPARHRLKSRTILKPKISNSAPLKIGQTSSKRRFSERGLLPPQLPSRIRIINPSAATQPKRSKPFRPQKLLTSKNKIHRRVILMKENLASLNTGFELRESNSKVCRATVPLTEANDRFAQCCKRLPLDNGCHSLCKYDLQLEEVQKAQFLGKCPYWKMSTTSFSSFLNCASGGKDHRDCCNKAGVKGHCLELCKARAPKIMTVDVFKCGTAFINKILRCHHCGVQ